jgi:type II secretory pathway pseudopilin PulG
MCKSDSYTLSAYGIIHSMRDNRKACGFTIIETLIVLAVSSALLIAAIGFLDGDQDRTSFTQSIVTEKSQIQQVINEVNSGSYPSNNNFTCGVNPSGGGILIQSVPTGTGQGTNTNCIFLGKVIQFDVPDTSPEEFNVFTVAGLHFQQGTTNDVTTYTQADSTVIEAGTNSDNTSIPNDAVQGELEYGLTTLPDGAYYTNSATNAPVNVGAVAFLYSLNTNSDGSIVTGSEQVNLVPVYGTSLGELTANMTNDIDNNLAADADNTNGSNAFNPSSGVSICFVSGATNQSGLITIGNNGRQLGVTLNIISDRTCT